MAVDNIGSPLKKINSTAGTLTIINGDTANYVFLQDVRISMTHTEYREPTTSGLPVYFSGQPNNRLSGTCVMSTEAWTKNQAAIKTLTTRSVVSGEVPTVTLEYNTTGADETFLNFEWVSAKCEGTVPLKAPEGGHKFEISFVLIGDPTITTG